MGRCGQYGEMTDCPAICSFQEIGEVGEFFGTPFLGFPDQNFSMTPPISTFTLALCLIR